MLPGNSSSQCLLLTTRTCVWQGSPVEGCRSQAVGQSLVASTSSLLKETGIGDRQAALNNHTRSHKEKPMPTCRAQYANQEQEAPLTVVESFFKQCFNAPLVPTTSCERWFTASCRRSRERMDSLLTVTWTSRDGEGIKATQYAHGCRGHG